MLLVEQCCTEDFFYEVNEKIVQRYQDILLEKKRVSFSNRCLFTFKNNIYFLNFMLVSDEKKQIHGSIRAVYPASGKDSKKLIVFWQQVRDKVAF